MKLYFHFCVYLAEIIPVLYVYRNVRVCAHSTYIYSIADR